MLAKFHHSGGAINCSVPYAEVHAEESQEVSAGEGPENNPQYTTVYVGNLAHEVRKKMLAHCFFVLLMSIELHLVVLVLEV